MRYQFIQPDGESWYNPRGWSASHSGDADTKFAPLVRNGQVIALVVATGRDAAITVHENGEYMATACSTHADLVAETVELRGKLAAMTERCEAMRAELEKRNGTPALVVDGADGKLYVVGGGCAP